MKSNGFGDRNIYQERNNFIELINKNVSYDYLAEQGAKVALLDLNEEAAKAKADEIAALAKEQGCKLLRDNCAELVMKGVTSVEELIRVTYAV